MAIFGAWTDAEVYVGPFNYSGFLNNVQLNYSADMLDKTVFGDTTKVSTPGLKNISLTGSGFADLADDGADERMFGNIGTADVPVTLMPTNTPAEGDRCYFFKSTQANYQIGGQHGAMLPFSFQADADIGHPLTRGWVLEPGTTARTTTASTTGFQATAVTASEYLYAVLHVVAVDTPTTLDVIIESDDNSGFTSATTRITFTQVTTAVSSEYATRVAGAITDDYWRITYTISGTSYTFACAMGIV